MLPPRRAPVPHPRIACLSSSARPIPLPRAATLGWSARPNVTAALFSSRGAAAALAGPRRPRQTAAAPHLPLGCCCGCCGCCYVVHQARGKKTRTTVKLEDLPQGLVAPLPPFPEQASRRAAAATAAAIEENHDEPPAYPTVVLQARRNMDKFANCVLLTRVGGFYELYFEQAEEYGPLLNLKVVHRKTNAGPVPMAGFPFFQLDRFLKILVQDLNRHVAIADEFPNDPSEKVKSGGLMHTRKVTRIVTPGTLIDENFMDPYANNYVMAIHLPGAGRLDEDVSGGRQDEPSESASEAPDDGGLGLAWLDLSTGSFYTQPATLSSLGSILSRVSPREVVLDRALESDENNALLAVLQEERYLVSYSSPDGSLRRLADWRPVLESEIPAETAAALTEPEVQAGSLLLHYVGDRLRGLSMKLQPPVRHESMHVMTIDKHSMRALELKQTIRDGAFKGSLLHTIRRTVTKSGARLLSEWLSAPSTSLEVINFRQNLVARFLEDEDLRDGVTTLLRRTHDSQRLVQKFALNRGDADDLLRLANTIKATEDIVSLLKSSRPRSSKRGKTKASSSTDQKQEDDCLSVMIDRIGLDQPRRLAQAIRDAIDEEGLVQQHQIEDSEAGEMMALAQEIVKTEGTDADATLLPKGASAKATKQQQQQQQQRRSTSSIRDYYGEDSEVWIMKPGASDLLSRLHAQLSDLKRQKEELTESLRARLGAASLTLRWTPQLGHVCHVKGKDAKRTPSLSDPSSFTTSSSSSSSSSDDQLPQDQQPPPQAQAQELRTLATSRTTRTFHLPEWTSLGESLDATRLQIRGEEQRVFAALRARVVRNLVRLRRNARVLDELDIAASFARLAGERGLVRPLVVDRPVTMIVGGRHATVEAGLQEVGRGFVGNDCFLFGGGGGNTTATAAPAAVVTGDGDGDGDGVDGINTDPPDSPSPEQPQPPLQQQQHHHSPSPSPNPSRIWLITGPNMAGKSTFLRQTALITILAQIGCYVPATSATVGLADAIFSRVGSADNLYADQSTFMVEMLETAAILRQATPRSLVIMDEVGRGTTPEDGAAVAFAALHHLATVNRSRVLFATHFHAVADLCAEHGLMAEDGGVVDAYCTDVQEDGQGGFVYVHKLRRGVNRQSHALKVARLAGVPEEAIRIAKKVLEREQRDHVSSSSSSAPEALRGEATEQEQATQTKTPGVAVAAGG